MNKIGPAIYLEEDGESQIQIILLDTNGKERRMPKKTPAEYLISVLDCDYAAYRKEVQQLRSTHPLFDEKIDIPEIEYKDLVLKARKISKLLEGIDPVGAFVVKALIDVAVKAPDDGSAMYLLNSGAKVIEVLDCPILAQIRLRNIFEIAFDTHERGTQRDRYEAVEDAWPGLLDRLLEFRLIPASGGDMPLSTRREYCAHTIYELYVIALWLYFQQDQQRIARCENCWRYFIPKTKKETLYCDRIIDGEACKKIGPNLKRKVGPEYDEALEIYNRLRERMDKRLERFTTAAPWEQDKLFPLSPMQYDEWLCAAHKVRHAYLKGEINSEEFLHAIDVYDDLTSYDAKKANLVDPEQTEWRRLIQKDIDFDPERSFQNFMFLDLRPGKKHEWQTFSKKDQAKIARGGLDSLKNLFKRRNGNKDEGKKDEP